jgi:protein O-mannosyl-transferase
LNPERIGQPGFAAPSAQPGSRPLLLLLPGWLVFVLYIPALLHGFVWDDTYFLSDLPYLRDPEMWRRHVFEPLFVSHNYFRPLPLMTFVLEARWGNLDPFVFHLTNVLLHSLNATLVVVLARMLNENLGDRRVAAWAGVAAGLFYGWHPALVEAVCWISDRFDLMMITFLLLALLAEARIRSARWRALAVGLLFMLAAFCKETAAVFAVLLPLWQLALAVRSGVSLRDSCANLVRRGGWTYAAVIAAGLIYLAVRFASLGFLYEPDAIMVGGGLLQHALLVAKTLGWYILLGVWPFGNLSPVYHAATPIAVSDLWAWASLGGLLLAGAAVSRLARKMPLVGWLVLAGFAAFLPVSNIVPLTIADNIVHDRYLALPLVFFALALAAWLGTLAHGEGRGAAAVRRIAVPLSLAWTVLACAAIVVTVPHWASNLTLWGWAYRTEPASRVAQGNYVTALANAGADQQALDLGRQILLVHPHDASAMHNMSLALMHMGRYEEAKAFSLSALKYFDPEGPKDRLDMSEALNLLGYLHMRLGELDAAEEALNRAIQLTPALSRPHFNLAMLDLERGREESARRELGIALGYDSPRMMEIHERFAAEKRADIARRRSLRPPS